MPVQVLLLLRHAQGTPVVRHKICSYFQWEEQQQKHFWALLGTLGASGHFWALLGTLGPFGHSSRSGHFWALLGTFGH